MGVYFFLNSSNAFKVLTWNKWYNFYTVLPQFDPQCVVPSFDCSFCRSVSWRTIQGFDGAVARYVDNSTLVLSNYWHYGPSDEQSADQIDLDLMSNLIWRLPFKLSKNHDASIIYESVQSCQIIYFNIQPHVYKLYIHIWLVPLDFDILKENRSSDFFFHSICRDRGEKTCLP